MTPHAASTLLPLEEGTFVVFELDTDATMWPLGPAAQDISAQVRTEKYVAFVGQATHAGEYDWQGRPLFLWELHLVGSAMPTRHPLHVTDEAMSVPLYPATARPPSESWPRAPLVPTPPFPPTWTNCYQHTVMTLEVYIGRVKDALCSKLSRKDVMRHYAYAYEDREREIQKFMSEIMPRGSEPVQQDVCVAQAWDGNDSAARGEKVRLADHELSNMEAPVDTPYYLPSPQSSQGARARVTVNVSLDLSSVPHPPDPRGFFQELDALKSIERAARQCAQAEVEAPLPISYLQPEPVMPPNCQWHSG